MIPTEAINQFTDKQKRLLRDTYDSAWQLGVDNYTPDADPETEPDTPRHLAEADLKGHALLALRRNYRYIPPERPDPVMRAIALAPAYVGLNKMAAELGGLTTALREAGGRKPKAAPDETAPEGPPEGPPEVPGEAWVGQRAVAQFGQNLQDWIDANATRLDAGASTAWAGEQGGFGQAASQDGQLLEWSDTGDDRECVDCEQLARFPPQALEDWPCQPGDGTTECNVGCRCSLDVSDVQPVPNDEYTPPLNGDQQDLVSNLATARANALDSAMPDAAYLE